MGKNFFPNHDLIVYFFSNSVTSMNCKDMNANRWCGFSTVQRPPASVPKVIFLQLSGLYETTELKGEF